MRSKTSFFNATLFKKNLSRFWPLWGMASFVGALVPLTMLMQMMRVRDFRVTEALVEQAYGTTLTVIVPIVSLLYAVLCAAAVWSYLYNPRSTGMMHRLPIRREGLFFTGFLSGMTMMLLPYVITGALTVLVTVLAGAVAPKALLMTILGVLGESFFYFSSATFAAFLTGNIFAMPVLYFLLHFLQPLVMFLVQVMQISFYYGVSGSYIHIGEWLCPTVHLMSNVQVQYQYEEIREIMPNGDSYIEQQLVGVTLEKGWLIGVYALAGVALLALAWVLYRKRHSENAGDVAAVGWMRPLFRYVGALLSGIAGGLLLYTLTWRPFQERYNAIKALPLLVCMVICGLIGYYGVSMVLAKSLKVFRRSLPGAALTVALLAVICGVFRFDLLGVESRVPSAQSVEAVDIWTNDIHLGMKTGRDDALIAQALDFHRTVVEDLDYIRADDEEPAQVSSAYTHVSMTYHLTNGETLDRRYQLKLREDRMAREDTYDHKLDRMVNSTEGRLLNLRVDEAARFISGELRDRDYNLAIPLLPQEAEALYEAVARDAVSGNWGRTCWFDNQLGEEFANVELQLRDESKRPGEQVDYRYLILRPEMTETIAQLRKLGMLEEDSLTLVDPHREQPENQTLADTEDYEFSVNGEAVEEITLEEAESIGTNGSLGVIGGADGSTAIYVTGAN